MALSDARLDKISAFNIDDRIRPVLPFVAYLAHQNAWSAGYVNRVTAECSRFVSLIVGCCCVTQ